MPERGQPKTGHGTSQELMGALVRPQTNGIWAICTMGRFHDPSRSRFIFFGDWNAQQGFEYLEVQADDKDMTASVMDSN